MSSTPGRTALSNTPLTKAVGLAVQSARKTAGRSLYDVAVAARQRGLSTWSESRVSDFEGGRVAPNLATLIALSLALQDLGCERVTLPELVNHDGDVQINDALSLTGPQLSSLIGGNEGAVEMEKPSATAAPDPETDTRWEDRLTRYVNSIQQPAVQRTFDHLITEAMGNALSDLREAQNGWGVAELRAKRSLNISDERFNELVFSLWGRSFIEERDSRAGTEANAQKRGRITRTMLKELAAAANSDPSPSEN